MNTHPMDNYLRNPRAHKNFNSPSEKEQKIIYLHTFSRFHAYNVYIIRTARVRDAASRCARVTRIYYRFAG